MYYCDSWQHHGPAFAAWPTIVFLVSLQSTVRSILPRSSTATSASFSASYFTGAQHGVARYLGNFAERGCSLCQQPVPRRQRIRRFLRRFRSRFPNFSFRFSFVPFSHTFSSHFPLFSRDHAFARTCILAYSRSPSSFLLSCCGCLSFLALPSALSSSSLYVQLPRASFTRNCFHPTKSFLLRTRFYHASRAHRIQHERIQTRAIRIPVTTIAATSTTTETTRRRVVYRTGRTHRMYATKFGQMWQLALD